MAAFLRDDPGSRLSANHPVPEGLGLRGPAAPLILCSGAVDLTVADVLVKGLSGRFADESVLG